MSADGRIVVQMRIVREEPLAEDERYPRSENLATFDLATDGLTAFSVFQKAMANIVSPNVTIAMGDPVTHPRPS